MSNFRNTRKVERDDVIVHQIADLMDSAYVAQSLLVNDQISEAKRVLHEATGAFVNRLALYCRRSQVTHKCELGHLYVTIVVEDDAGIYEATLKARSADVKE